MAARVAKVVKIVGNVVFVISLVICLFFSIFTIPRLFGIKPFVVQSSSMEPTISTGSVVFVDTKDTDVEVDDIITFSLAVSEDKGVYVTHRVYAVNNGLIQTKGDNNDNADGWLKPSAVTGTYLLHIPALGFLLDKLQSYGFVLIAIWIFVINLILMLFSRILELYVMSHEKEQD